MFFAAVVQRETCPDAALLSLAWLHWACCAVAAPFVVLFNYAYYCAAATVTSPPTHCLPSPDSYWGGCSRCGLLLTSASVFGCSCCCCCCLLCMQSECPVNGSVVHFRSVPAACCLSTSSAVCRAFRLARIVKWSTQQ